MRYLLRICFSFVLSAAGLVSLGQDFLGIANSNYAGVTGLDLNPASIADSRYKFDMTLVGIHSSLANDFFKVKREELFNGFPGNIPFADRVIETDRIRPYDFFARTNISALSFQFTLKDNSAFAISTRNRSITALQNVDPTLAKLALEGLEFEPLWETQIQSANMNFQALNFQEFGVAYARPFLNLGEHYLKAGGRLKVLLGLGAAYFNVDDLSYQFVNDDSLLINLGGGINIGYSDDFYLESRLVNDFSYRNNVTGQPTIGGDVGVVYEWRPKYKEHLYNMDGQTDLERPDRNKYKVRVGFSMTDLGSIRFRSGAINKRVTVDVDNEDLNGLQEWDISNVEINGVDELLDTLANRGFSITDRGSFFNVPLPMRMNFTADYHIWKDFYVNLTLSPQLKLGERGQKEFSNYSITPRYDYKWFTFALPLQVNGMGQFNMGAAFRAGPLILGTNTLSELFKDGLRSLDVYFALKVPIFRKVPKDRDQDQVSDKVDICPDVPGVWVFKGCPDIDEDGIEDKLDDCPTEPGLPQFNGCPDTDNDGIMDKEDECPTIPGIVAFKGCPDTDNDGIEDRKDDCPQDSGLLAFNGCPDRDGDKVMDKRDSCPDTYGLAQFNGCPDTDSDGVMDKEDSCVNIVGLAKFNGCPDTDNDGLPDKDDACPNKPGPIAQDGCPDTDGDGLYDHKDGCPLQPGPLSNNGCPETDTDKDGLPDKVDQCPQIAGPASNNGCPEIDEDEEAAEILKTAYENLEFETGKAVIANRSFASLLQLVELLKKRNLYMLRITGHTDNVGDAASNLVLSRQRAGAVKEFLMDNGISEDRLLSEGFGETQPIAPNTTPEGRAKNRRVELKVLKIEE